ncbi:MAG TPA: XdhC/CoxI family protein [Chloroflexota bacterium]|nr:XdhC/CoxI family protein [Chloroflexota bacterium]
MRDVLPQIEQWRAEGKAVALATVVSVAGSAPRGVGAKLVVADTGEMAGSVSGGCVENAVIETGLEVLANGESQLVRYGVSDEDAWEVGLACGGTIEVLVEKIGEHYEALRRAILDDVPVASVTIARGEPLGKKLLVYEAGTVEGSLGSPALDAAAKAAAQEQLNDDLSGLVSLADGVEAYVDVFTQPARLVIVGAVHTAIALSRIGKLLGFRVSVIDPRERFATAERFPHVDDLVVAWPDEALSELNLDSRSYIAILTHDPKFDEPALLTALAGPARYIGAIGSRKTSADRAERLKAQGITAEQLARIHAPIGLQLDAKTPEEIALAIAAEIVATRRGWRNGAPAGAA